MPTEADPVVGHWYRHTDRGQIFQVVAFDEEEGLVEMQNFDGDLEETDLSTWYTMNIEVCEEPEDWTGPMDNVQRDDLGYTEP